MSRPPNAARAAESRLATAATPEFRGGRLRAHGLDGSRLPYVSSPPEWTWRAIALPLPLPGSRLRGVFMGFGRGNRSSGRHRPERSPASSACTGCHGFRAATEDCARRPPVASRAHTGTGQGCFANGGRVAHAGARRATVRASSSRCHRGCPAPSHTWLRHHAGARATQGHRIVGCAGVRAVRSLASESTQVRTPVSFRPPSTGPARGRRRRRGN
jgi:hypothetical protein